MVVVHDPWIRMPASQPCSQIPQFVRQQEVGNETGLIEQDLDEFNKFVQTYPHAGDDLSLEDYVCLWRAAPVLARSGLRFFEISRLTLS